MQREFNDYSAVEKALAQNEAPARMRVLVGEGIRYSAIIIAFGVSISCMALSIGKGVSLAKEPKIAENFYEFPEAPALSPSQENEIVRNYVIFHDVESKIVDETISVTAGHEYMTSNQHTYDRAFCYTILLRNGVLVRVNLSEKQPDRAPMPLVDQNLRFLNVTRQHIQEMQDLCPYL